VFFLANNKREVTTPHQEVTFEEESMEVPNQNWDTISMQYRKGWVRH
jgi:hypothetical protein